jgi:nicotinamide-nucleotide amidase
LNRAQADVPDGCEVIQNKNGTAPCMWFEDRGTIFVSMPGVPFEMMYLMEEEILPRLKSLFELPFIYHKTILTANIGESFLAQEIESIEASLPSYIKLAYLPKLGQVRLRLSATGLDEVALKIEVDEYAKKLIERMEPYVIAEEDIPLEQALLQLMEQHELTFSTAESCTGGYIAHLITQVPGSSKSFEGGAVTYSYDLKQIILGVQQQTLADYGAVSEETVKEMALGANKRFHTDFSVAVSGIAGPGGGLPGKPVGTVWIAVAYQDQVVAKMFLFGERRIQNIERSAAAALNMLFTQVKLQVTK